MASARLLIAGRTRRKWSSQLDASMASARATGSHEAGGCRRGSSAKRSCNLIA